MRGANFLTDSTVSIVSPPDDGSPVETKEMPEVIA